MSTGNKNGGRFLNGKRDPHHRKVRYHYLGALIFSSLVCLLYSRQTHAQYREMLKTNVVPPSPNAASLLAYTNVGNNFAKGTVNLSIPLFDASVDDIKLPITLDYGYDGFKPYQQIGWTGLGWNLIAGGSISRIPFGHLDDTSPSGRNYKDVQVQNGMNMNPTFNFMQLVNENFYDTEPDVYEYSFAGYSGRFIRFKGNTYCMPNNKFKVQASGQGFIITTEDGVRYTFDATETTTHKVNGEPYTLPPYVSTCYLTKIQSPSGFTLIEFQYASEGTVEQGGGISQTYKKVAMPYSSYSQLNPIASTFAARVTTVRLAKILTPEYTINFLGGENRQDIQNFSGSSKVLGEMQVVNAEGVQVKRYRFNYGYFNPTGTNVKKYLKLASIQEMEIPQSVDGELLPIEGKSHAHSFSYYSENASFPGSSANVDENGYYTGRGNFTGVLVPNTYYPGGPNRSPALSGTMMGALQKITYPTGGNTTIAYELNVRGTGERYLEINNGISLQAGGSFYEGMPPIRKEFTFDKTQTIVFHLRRKAYSPYGDNNARNSIPDFRLTRIHDGDAFTPVFDYRASYESDSSGVTFSTQLTPGHYEARVENDPREQYVTCDFSYLMTSNIPVVGEPSSGLRMRSMEIDQLNGPKMRKVYSYINDRGFSTGNDNRPGFSANGYTEILFQNNSSEPTEMNATIYGSTIAPSGAFGQTYFYSLVDELQISATDTVKIRRTFTDYNRDFNLNADPDTIITYRKVGNRFVQIHRKNMRYNVVVDTFFNTFRVRQIKGAVGLGGPSTGSLYDYTSEIGTHYQVWKTLASEREYNYDGAVGIISSKDYGYDYGHRNLSRTVSSKSNGDAMISKFKYPSDYVSAISGTLVNANMINVPLEEQQWRKRGSDSVMVSLRVTQYDNTSFNPSKIYSYEGGANSLNAETKTLTKYNTLLSDNRLAERIAFTYNNKGQLVSQKLTDGVAKSYQYGYPSNALLFGVPAKDLKVVASIENAAPQEFFYDGFEHTGLQGNAHSGAKYHAGSYTVNWVKPNNRSYVMDYWILENGIWKYRKQAYQAGQQLATGQQGIDDLRIFPSDASISSLTYFPGIGIRSQVAPNGLTSFYSYDGFGRLFLVKDDEGNLVRSFKYNYVDNNE